MSTSICIIVSIFSDTWPLAGSYSFIISSSACEKGTGSWLCHAAFLAHFVGEAEGVTPLAFLLLPLGLGGMIKVEVTVKKRTKLCCDVYRKLKRLKVPNVATIRKCSCSACENVADC